MNNKEEQIKRIEAKLKLVREKQVQFSREIEDLAWDLDQLRSFKARTVKMNKNLIRPNDPAPKKMAKSGLKIKPDLERLIGENLISKVGMLLTIIGVIIGVKYSIEHQLISPIIRILLGYFSSVILLFFSLKLKKSFFNYSAILLSGAMSIAYFVTFAAHSFYAIIPQILAFLIMVLITFYTVYQAINYKREIIAHIGLIGAYAIPFLIGNESGNPTILLSYIAIINVGILSLSFFNHWKVITYSSFSFTWLIYLFWFWDNASDAEQFSLALTFSVIYFATFYALTLCHKLIRKKTIKGIEVFLVLSNSFIFYAIVYALFSKNDIGYLGIMTFSHALIHAIVVLIILRIQDAEEQLINFILGLALVFTTIAIPVQLDGHWVTMLWSAEAALLFWLGRKKDRFFFERLAYPMLLLSFFSLNLDWRNGYYTDESFPSIANNYFLGSVFSIVAYGLITFFNHKMPIKWRYINWQSSINNGLAILLLLTLFGSFYHEISYYWNERYAVSELFEGAGVGDMDLIYFKNSWLIIYSLLFTSSLGIANLRLFKSPLLAKGLSYISLLFLLVFCSKGLYMLTELRTSYLSPPHPERFEYSKFNIGIRYLSIASFASLIVLNYISLKGGLLPKGWKKKVNLVIHLLVIWILSDELVNLFELNEIQHSTKIGLSILWNSYSLFLILLGIAKSESYLRITAICLFAITLIKLFIYDIAHLDMLRKTIVFVVLGILLLVISYFYNKNKEKLFGNGID